VKVTATPVYVTVPATGVVPWFTVKVKLLTVVGFSASLKNAPILVLIDTFIAPFALMVEVTVGGVVSGSFVYVIVDVGVVVEVDVVVDVVDVVVVLGVVVVEDVVVYTGVDVGVYVDVEVIVDVAVFVFVDVTVDVTVDVAVFVEVSVTVDVAVFVTVEGELQADNSVMASIVIIDITSHILFLFFILILLFKNTLTFLSSILSCAYFINLCSLSFSCLSFSLVDYLRSKGY